MRYQIVHRTREGGPRVRTIIDAADEQDANYLAVNRGIQHIEDIRPASDWAHGPDFEDTDYGYGFEGPAVSLKDLPEQD